MKKTILSLFFLATLGITSCSSDSNSESSVNPNDLLVVAFKATGEGTNIENFARDKAGTKVLSLDGQPSSVSFTNVTITKNGVNSNTPFTIQGTNVTTKDNTPVGEYTISYKITNGSTTTDSVTQTFTVFHNENKTVDGVTATIYQFRNNYLNGNNNDSNEHQTFDGIKVPSSANTITLNGVPYQFLVGSRLYQLSLESPSETQYDFSNRDNDGQWSICVLSLPSTFDVNFILPTGNMNKSVRTKTYNQIINNQITRSITFYELKLDSDVLNYSDFENSTLNSSLVVTFSTDQI